MQTETGACPAGATGRHPGGLLSGRVPASVRGSAPLAPGGPWSAPHPPLARPWQQICGEGVCMMWRPCEVPRAGLGHLAKVQADQLSTRAGTELRESLAEVKPTVRGDRNSWAAISRLVLPAG